MIHKYFANIYLAYNFIVGSIYLLWIMLLYYNKCECSKHIFEKIIHVYWYVIFVLDILLFFGFLGNELISLGYRMILRGVVNPQCALTYSSEGSPFVLPSPITQTVGFFAGFFFMEMYFNDTFSPMKFFLLSALLLITIYSRINIGCKTLLDAIYCALVGLLMGVIYYNLIKDYYKADYLEEDITQIDKDINNFFTLN